MFKVALLIWVVLGTVLAGMGVVFVVSNASLYDSGMKLIPIVSAIGFVVAIPLAMLIAKRVLALTGGK